MALITDEYRKINEEIHKTKESYGTSGANHLDDIMELIFHIKTEDVLDYGCGKGLLAQNIPFKIKQYDPCIPKHSQRPEPADLVVCTDVLEHVEPECIDDVLDDIKSLTKRFAYLVIPGYKAKRILPDGRNAHLIQRDSNWWLDKIIKRFTLMGFVNMVEDDDKHGYRELYILTVRNSTSNLN